MVQAYRAGGPGSQKYGVAKAVDFSAIEVPGSKRDKLDALLRIMITSKMSTDKCMATLLTSVRFKFRNVEFYLFCMN
jgi:hypothetical protein